MRVIKPLVLSLLLLIAGTAMSLSAQNRVVSGKVLDAQEQPMFGVVVQVEGTTLGDATSDDGSFKFEVPQGEVVLKVSLIGYLSQTVKVPANKSTVTVYLQEDVIQLDEAVVVGYGTQKRVNLTGSVSVVSNKDIENRVAQSATHMLQGTVAGLNITTSSGKPGSTAAINIRGTTSINGESEPLVIIDGAVGDLNRINPNDIEAISVIKDGSAAAVYGARAAFGVILVTTKSGSAKDGKATVRYSGRLGWQAPTTSTDYESRGYWSVYTVNKFFSADSGNNYFEYNDRDMQQLLARVHDKTEHPDRPWVVREERNGKDQWLYYGNNDWWNMLYRDNRPTQQHNISLSGGSKDIKYLVSGAYDRQEGMLKQYPDTYNKYNLRSKIDFRINQWATLSNNTSFFSSKYTALGNGSIDDTIAYSARHALANIPMQNPDGSWIYGTPYSTYKVANGRHIILGLGTHRINDVKTDFSNTTRLEITPIKPVKVTADFTYRLYQDRNTRRSQPLPYRVRPDESISYYDTGAGQNQLDEAVKTRDYYSTNIYANYDQTFGEHHVSGVVGANYELYKFKNVSAWGRNLASPDLDDLGLTGQNKDGVIETGVDGGQGEYALLGYFARINYDYKGRYLFEVSGRYDGTTRFTKDSRWGMFPSASAGWRISEESFFEPLRSTVDNVKLRASYGSLGNQNISDYYTWLRLVAIKDFKGYTFGEGASMGRYSTLGEPVSGDLTWETAKQWNVGLDVSMLNNRLNFTTEVYIRDTKDMLMNGAALPAVYGAKEPMQNAADLRTEGYELSINWRDQFQVANKPFEYSVGFNLSDYKSTITKYDNPEKSLAKKYYKGMRYGEIWGYRTDGFFKTDEEATAYAAKVDMSGIPYRGVDKTWKAGDLKYLDINGDGIINMASNTVDDPGDRTILGNSTPSLSYGMSASIRWFGFDASVLFQGTGNHYWYPHGQMMSFWGPYSYPYLSFMPTDFIDRTWSEDNPDAYFPRPVAYGATSGTLSWTNDKYLQNLRYLRLKNLTIGYTIPAKITKLARIELARVYFSGENLHYWSPLKKNSKYVDPEGAIDRKTEAHQNAFYPWPKTYMFGIDITF